MGRRPSFSGRGVIYATLEKMFVLSSNAKMLLVLKLTYKAKDGSFKGSFRVYALVDGKIKACSANVTGA